MVSMDVRFDDKGERQAQLFNCFEVAFDVFDDGINDDRLARIAVGNDVGAAFRPVINVLYTINVQEGGDSICVSDCHGMHSEAF